MMIGINLSNEDWFKYTKSDRYSGNYPYKFEEIVIGTIDNNEINYLFARFDEDNIDIEINDTQVKTVDEKKFWGINYQNQNYDKEQQLRKYIYKDKKKNIKAITINYFGLS